MPTFPIKGIICILSLIKKNGEPSFALIDPQPISTVYSYFYNITIYGLQNEETANSHYFVWINVGEKVKVCWQTANLFVFIFHFTDIHT
jgi:hypothetical protein